jgi:hypothetical protein
MHGNEWWRGCLRVMLPLAPLVAIAMPAHAQGLGCPGGPNSCVATDPAGLADTAEPGAVLVFPKFAQGTAVLDNSAIEPNTQIEIAAVCPAPAPPNFPGATTSPQTCQPFNYEVEVHWVCPGVMEGQENSVCPENDFQVYVSTYGKVVFNPNGLAPPAITANARISGYPALNGTGAVPQAPCARGYALAYVVDSQLRPLDNNVLIGDSVQRNNFLTMTNNDLQSYSALAIQSVQPNTNGTSSAIGSVANAAPGHLISTSVDPITQTASLPFTGLANSYQMVTGQFYGDIRFNQDTGTSPGTPFADTALILLTLDVRSNLPNDPTQVNLQFYNAKEVPVSTFWQFDCWDQVQLAPQPGSTKFIDANLTFAAMGTPNGVVVSGQAFNSAPLNQPRGFRTILGLIQTSEGPVGGVAAATRSYTVRPSNNSIPVPTFFVFD